MPVPSRTPEDFSRQLAHALSHEPKPMLAADYRRLTWEDATERFLDVTEISRVERAKPLEAAFDTFAYNAHNMLTGNGPGRGACMRSLAVNGRSLWILWQSNGCSKLLRVCRCSLLWRFVSPSNMPSVWRLACSACATLCIPICASLLRRCQAPIAGFVQRAGAS